MSEGKLRTNLHSLECTILPSEEEAIHALSNQLGQDVSDLSPDEIFCIEVCAWVDQNEKVI